MSAARQLYISLTRVAMKPPRELPTAPSRRALPWRAFRSAMACSMAAQAAAGVLGWAGITTSISGLFSATQTAICCALAEPGDELKPCR